MLLFFSLSLVVLSAGAPSWRSCSFCETIITDANEYFGATVTTTKDGQFMAYFKVRCPQYEIMSPIMSLICDQMIETHPVAVFSGLRQQTVPQTICQTCQDC